MIAELLTLQAMGTLLLLTLLELVLGIDNIVFIALLVEKLPKKTRDKARKIAIFMALVMRIILLFGVAWILSLSKPWFTAFGHEMSGKSILLIAGGLFLIYKSTESVHEIFTPPEDESTVKTFFSGFWGVVAQAMLIDLVFSFDSILTAVGITTVIPIIVIAMVIAMFFMLFATNFIAEFIIKYPTLKTLAVSFILLIGTLLVAEGLGFHIPRGYIYFSMAFSVGVETLNILSGKRRHSRIAIPLERK